MPRRLSILLLSVCLAVVAFAPAAASAYPFNRVDRLDVNGADEYDYMDLDEVDFLRALKLMERRRETGEYARIEDLTEVLSPDLFGMLADTVEVGSFRGPRDAFYSGNSFSDVKWYMDRDQAYAWRGLYNFHLSDRVYARVAYSNGTEEGKLRFDDLFLNYYQWSDGFFPAGKVSVPRPKAEVRAKIEEGYVDLEQRVLADFNARYGHEMSIGRKRRRMIHGLYDTDLKSYQKHWLVKAPKEPPKKPAPPPAAEAKPAPGPPEKPLLPYKMRVPVREEKAERAAPAPVMVGIWTLGDVMFPQGMRPLLSLHRTGYRGVKYERILDQFRAGMLYKRDETGDLQAIGGNAYARVAGGDAIVGARANRVYARTTDNDIQHVSIYAMGDTGPDKSTHLYGEYQSVFGGASSIQGLISTRFRDLFLTTRILSVKEDWQGPAAVAPFSFDGEFTTHLRLSYLFSGISSVSVWTERSKVQAGDPDFELGVRHEHGARMFLKPTEKALFTLGYRQARHVDGTLDDIYLGRLRYRYRPRFHIFLTSELTDRDVRSQLGRLATNGIEFRWRARDNLKVNLEFTDRWDEALAGTDREHEGIGRINYYYNF